MWEDTASGWDEGEDGTPPRARKSPRKSPAGHQQAEEDFEALQAHLQRLAEMAWCGQAEKLGCTEKEILSHYEHEIVFEKKLKGAFVLREPLIKYRLKYETTAKMSAMSMKGLNPTRLGERLLKSNATPMEIKQQVGRKMRSQFARQFIASFDAKKASEDEAIKASELLTTRRDAMIDGEAKRTRARTPWSASFQGMRRSQKSSSTSFSTTCQSSCLCAASHCTCWRVYIS